MIAVGKPKLVVGFVDYWQGMDDFFIGVLSERYEVIRNDVQPDFLFFADELFGTSNALYNNKKNVKIFYTGENIRPDPNRFKFHRAISFDFIDEEWHFRLPLYAIDYWRMVHSFGMKTIEEAQRRRIAAGRNKFFCFISGNPVSKKINDLFALLEIATRKWMRRGLCSTISDMFCPGGWMPRRPRMISCRITGSTCARKIRPIPDM